MSDRPELLRRQRDQALRDIVELERQVDEGEIPSEAAERLRARYEASAAQAMSLLDSAADGKRPAKTRGPVTAYLVAAAAALFAVVVLLPDQLADRPEGGAVSGNEVLQQPTRDLSTVTDEEMEQVVAANPGGAGMRLALVRRYVGGGAFENAVSHLEVLAGQQLSARDRVAAESLMDEMAVRGDVPQALRDRLAAIRPAVPR